MPISAHFIFRIFWDFSRKRKKVPFLWPKTHFVAKKNSKNGHKI